MLSSVLSAGDTKESAQLAGDKCRVRDRCARRLVREEEWIPGLYDYISISITSPEITDVALEQVAWPMYKV